MAREYHPKKWPSKTLLTLAKVTSDASLNLTRISFTGMTKSFPLDLCRQKASAGDHRSS